MKKLIITLLACAASGSLVLADGPAEGPFGTTGVDSNYLNYELPKVETDVSVGGLRLTVDRASWAVGVASRGGSCLGTLASDGVHVRVSEVPGPSTMAPQGEEVLSSYPVTSHGVHGTKVVYGTQPNFLFRHITAIQYYFTNREGRTICFDAQPGAAHPDWSVVNDLMRNNVRYAGS